LSYGKGEDLNLTYPESTSGRFYGLEMLPKLVGKRQNLKTEAYKCNDNFWGESSGKEIWKRGSKNG
jgi:hypothetical protein